MAGSPCASWLLDRGRAWRSSHIFHTRTCARAPARCQQDADDATLVAATRFRADRGDRTLRNRDARLIADYVTVMPTRVVERNPALERLAETVTMRRQLCDEHIAVQSQPAI